RRERRSRRGKAASIDRVAAWAPIHLAPLALTQLDAPDLPAHRLRQRVHELDRPRIFVRRGDALHVVLQRTDELVTRLMAGMQHDEGLDDLATYRVRARDHRGLDHRRMLEQRTLDLERTDPVAGRADDVVRATDQPE